VRAAWAHPIKLHGSSLPLCGPFSLAKAAHTYGSVYLLQYHVPSYRGDREHTHIHTQNQFLSPCGESEKKA